MTKTLLKIKGVKADYYIDPNKLLDFFVWHDEVNDGWFVYLRFGGAATMSSFLVDSEKYAQKVIDKILLRFKVEEI